MFPLNIYFKTPVPTYQIQVTLVFMCMSEKSPLSYPFCIFLVPPLVSTHCITVTHISPLSDFSGSSLCYKPALLKSRVKSHVCCRIQWTSKLLPG